MPTMVSLLIALAMSAAARGGAPAAQPLPVLQPVVVRSAHEPTPGIRVWFDGDDVYRRGDRARVYFRADEDVYVLILRIDTDGQMRVLYPLYSSDDVMARAGRTYRVAGPGHDSFVVDDGTGMGYVFALASRDPFDLDRIAEAHGGAYRYASLSRVHGDPFVAVQDFADDLFEDDGAYALDYAEYHVDRRVEYPRFLCYDCHAHRSYPAWDVYGRRCRVYRVVVYDDPYYYPYRVYGGSRVVYARRPRYEFKTASRGNGGAAEPFIEYRRRPDDVDRRRPGTPSADPNLPPRGRDVNPGATRPGDDVVVGGGRRRVRTDADDGAPAPVGPAAHPPRRETSAGGSTDESQPVVGRPRQDPPRQENPSRQEDPPRQGDQPRHDDDRGAPIAAGRPAPRAIPGGEDRDDSRGGGSDRRPEGRPEARPEPRAERRGEPRAEPRAEPRVEPRSEPRVERSAPRSEPRAEPQPPPSRGSESRESRGESRPSKSSDGESGRRRTPER